MSERVHFIPVGFDFERLIHPISKGDLEADRVVLITHDNKSAIDDGGRAANLGSNMTKRLEDAFQLIDIEVEREFVEVSDLHDYELQYPRAHDYILDELEEGNEVFVNISSMPRTIAFAFATAADSIIAEFQGDIDQIRDRLHTYYVAPQDYLVLEMIETLEDVADTFDGLTERYEDLFIHEQHEDVQKLLSRIDENGVTEGAKDLDGQMYVEFPASPGSNIEGTEGQILKFLSDREPVPSTSALAEQLADQLDETYDESFRSRIQYNVSKLEDKGYVDRSESGNRLETRLSTMGRMWVKTHD